MTRYILCYQMECMITASGKRSNHSVGRERLSSSNRLSMDDAMLADVLRRREKKLHKIHDFSAVRLTLLRYFMPGVRGKSNAKFEFLIQNSRTPGRASSG